MWVRVIYCDLLFDAENVVSTFGGADCWYCGGVVFCPGLVVMIDQMVGHQRYAFWRCVALRQMLARFSGVRASRAVGKGCTDALPHQRFSHMHSRIHCAGQKTSLDEAGRKQSSFRVLDRWANLLVIAKATGLKSRLCCCWQYAVIKDMIGKSLLMYMRCPHGVS